MTVKQNIFLAKKLFVELVYNTAYIEGCNVTFPETQVILSKGILKNANISDVPTVLNLRDAWKYAINSVGENSNLNLDFLKTVNHHVSKEESLDWGVLRYGDIGISGTSYKPMIPEEYTVKNDLNNILSTKAQGIDVALELFCYITYKQLFWDGNKRTATICANKILIESGQGILTIDKKNSLKFNKDLLHLYNTGDKEKLKKTLNKCIRTLNIKNTDNNTKI